MGKPPATFDFTPLADSQSGDDYSQLSQFVPIHDVQTGKQIQFGRDQQPPVEAQMPESD